MRAIRQLPDPHRKVLYLTFDDGPDPQSTEAVLNLLSQHQVRATFFLVSEKAKRETALTERIQKDGHTVGNHSLDHGYSRFFQGKKSIQSWVDAAEQMLRETIGEPTAGFRPPAGVRTPELHAALREMRMPLILWNTRFFDTTFTWTQARALRSLRRARSGDIILLHDRQSVKKLPVFLKSLDAYIRAALDAGFEFDVLTRSKLEKNL